MGERWFTEEELAEMSRPTMDRAIEALERGDLDEARSLCEAMKHEWRHLYDLMVEGIRRLITFGQERTGGDAVAEPRSRPQGRRWKRDVEPTVGRARLQI